MIVIKCCFSKTVWWPVKLLSGDCLPLSCLVLPTNTRSKKITNFLGNKAAAGLKNVTRKGQPSWTRLSCSFAINCNLLRIHLWFHKPKSLLCFTTIFLENRSGSWCTSGRLKTMDILDVENLNGGLTDARDLNDKQLIYQTSLQRGCVHF